MLRTSFNKAPFVSVEGPRRSGTRVDVDVDASKRARFLICGSVRYCPSFVSACSMEADEPMQRAGNERGIRPGISDGGTDEARAGAWV